MHQNSITHNEVMDLLRKEDYKNMDVLLSYPEEKEILPTGRAITVIKQIQNLARSLLQLWNLMDTPIEEQQMFQSVTCNIAASEQEITKPNMPSIEFINIVEAEVSRLEEMKASKMKELVFKKILELEDICRKTHLLPESDTSMEISLQAIKSGAIGPDNLFEQIEGQIGKIKEEAFSRKEITEMIISTMLAEVLILH